jgi:hypothetical protein
MGRKLITADLHPTKLTSQRIGRIHDLRPSNSCYEFHTCGEQQAIVRFVEQYLIERISPG